MRQGPWTRLPAGDTELEGWGDWLRSPEAFQAGVEGSGWAWIPSTSAQGIVFQDASCTTCGDVLLNELIDKAKASPTLPASRTMPCLMPWRSHI